MQFTKFLKITKISPSEANYEDLSNEVDNGAPIETCNGEKSLQANVKGKAVADNSFFLFLLTISQTIWWKESASWPIL